MCNVHLTVLLFGTNELKSIKSSFCESKRFQIVDRYYNVIEFSVPDYVIVSRDDFYEIYEIE